MNLTKEQKNEFLAYLPYKMRDPLERQFVELEKLREFKDSSERAVAGTVTNEDIEKKIQEELKQGNFKRQYYFFGASFNYTETKVRYAIFRLCLNSLVSIDAKIQRLYDFVNNFTQTVKQNEKIIDGNAVCINHMVSFHAKMNDTNNNLSSLVNSTNCLTSMVNKLVKEIRKPNRDHPRKMDKRKVSLQAPRRSAASKK